MKEKRFKKGLTKRLFSVVLALTMVLALMPSTTAFAYNSTDMCECGHYYSYHDDGGWGCFYGMCNSNCNLSSFVLHTHNSSAYGSDTTQHWTKCTKDNNNNGTPENHTWLNGQCSVCQYTCEHPGMTASNATCGTCGKANPDYVPPHSHGSWEYTASGATLTAECKATTGTCELENHKVSLTLSASSANYSGIENLEAFNAATEKTIEESNVEIYKVDAADTTTGGTKVTGTPSEDGYYYAALTVEGQKAVKAFTIGTPGGSGSGTTITCPGGHTVNPESNYHGIQSSEDGCWNYCSQPGYPLIDRCQYSIGGDTFFYSHDGLDECPLCGWATLVVPTCTCTNESHGMHYYLYKVDDDDVYLHWYLSGNYISSENYSKDFWDAPSMEIGWYFKPDMFTPMEICTGETPHEHTWTYNADGTTLTATCGNSDDKCELNDGTGAHKVSLTLTANSANYSGSAYTEATLEGVSDWTDAGFELPTILYIGTGETTYEESDIAPSEIGTYTAMITFEGETVSVDFEIKAIKEETEEVTTEEVTTEEVTTEEVTTEEVTTEEVTTEEVTTEEVTTEEVTTEEETEEVTTEATVTTPATKDSTPLMLYAMVMVVASAGIVVLKKKYDVR